MGSRTRTLRFDTPALWMRGGRDESPDGEVSRALVERAVSGDAEAFEQIVVHHERRILNLALRFTGDMADAQDASQETFLRAYRYLHRLDTDRPIRPWLMRIAVNVCCDLFRRRQADRNSDLAPAPDTSPETPHTQLAADEDKRRLRAALGGLPEKQRAAIVLRDIEGLTTREVAEVLGSSESTVRVQISRARLRLREILRRRERKEAR
jgi:RNA polymerase sigma-70 factor (ECF subfamily)